MQRIRFFLFAAILTHMPAFANVTDSLLTEYCHDVSRSAHYISRRQSTIDSLRLIAPFSYDAQLRLGNEYRSLQSDSARSSLFRLLEAPEPYRTQAKISLIRLFESTGLYYDGMIVVRSVDSVPHGARAMWFDAQQRLYHGAADKTTLAHVKDSMNRLATACEDSLHATLAELAATEPTARYDLGYLTALAQRHYPEALAYNDSALSLYRQDSHPYAIYAYRRATVYGLTGEDERQLEWLIRSAIADVQSGITDNGASWLVAQHCFERGDIDRAYQIIDYSMSNASFFNTPSRYLQIYPVGHIISVAHEQQQRRAARRMLMAITGGFVVLLLIISVAAYALRQNHKLHLLNDEMLSINSQLKETNKSLKDANIVKQQYICRYLEVHSEYIRRLTTMARKAGEKDPTAFMNREMDDFYRSFDDTFLSLYGNFVQDFNALLRPEAQITPKPGERMTIEMRIFALILLGIDSSAKIAELLCYSPNTISNYRVKIKNNALGKRDSFEDEVKRIGNRQ